MIPAGGKGFVTAQFNAAAMGSFTKTVTVRSNASETPVVTLTISGEVVNQAAEPQK